jgi:hypothetical protein
METGLKIGISIAVIGLAATGGYLYWKSKQDEDEGEDEATSVEPSKMVVENKPKTLGGEPVVENKPKTLGGEPIAELKTTVMLFSGTYFVDRNKVLYYDGINKLWKPEMKLKVYDPESIKKTFIPANYKTGQLLPSDEEKYQKLLGRYQKDLVELDRHWPKLKLKWPSLNFSGSQKVMAIGSEKLDATCY